MPSGCQTHSATCPGRVWDCTSVFAHLEVRKKDEAGRLGSSRPPERPQQVPRVPDFLSSTCPVFMVFVLSTHLFGREITDVFRGGQCWPQRVRELAGGRKAQS